MPRPGGSIPRTVNSESECSRVGVSIGREIRTMRLNSGPSSSKRMRQGGSDPGQIIQISVVQ